LGLGDVSSQSSPKELKFFNGMNVKQIFCGHDHNVALCGKFISLIFEENGKIYVWGYNEYGQLGIGNLENQNTPKELLLNKEMKNSKIFCGSYQTFFC
jgi:alpha-tubulin suppressor-like RCC1 family protein